MQNYNDHVDRADYEELIDYGPLKAATLRVGFLHRILQDRITPAAGLLFDSLPANARSWKLRKAGRCRLS